MARCLWAILALWAHLGAVGSGSASSGTRRDHAVLGRSTGGADVPDCIGDHGAGALLVGRMYAYRRRSGRVEMVKLVHVGCEPGQASKCVIALKGKRKQVDGHSLMPFVSHMHSGSPHSVVPPSYSVEEVESPPLSSRSVTCRAGGVSKKQSSRRQVRLAARAMHAHLAPVRGGFTDSSPSSPSPKKRGGRTDSSSLETALAGLQVQGADDEVQAGTAVDGGAEAIDGAHNSDGSHEAGVDGSALLSAEQECVSEIVHLDALNTDREGLKVAAAADRQGAEAGAGDFVGVGVRERQERAKAMLKKARQKKCKPKAQSDVEDTPAVASLEDVGRRIKTIRRKIKRAIALRTIAAEGRELPSKDAAKVAALDEMERELAVLREEHKRLTRAARRSAQELEMAAAAEMAAAPPGAPWNALSGGAEFPARKNLCTIVVDGDPVALKRPRHRFGGHTYDPNYAAKKSFVQMAQAQLPAEPLAGGIGLSLLFELPRAKQHFATAKKHAGSLKRSAPLLPCKVPDLDNLVKFVLDALNQHLFVDDKQICEIYARKAYRADAGPGRTVVQVSHM